MAPGYPMCTQSRLKPKDGVEAPPISRARRTHGNKCSHWRGAVPLLVDQSAKWAAQSYQAIYKDIAAAAQLTEFFLSFFAVQQLAGCAHAHAEWYREGA